MVTGTVGSVLVISASWETRALLAAQLSDTTGQQVVSASRVNAALALVKVAGLHPIALVVDADQQTSREEVEHLVAALPHTPLILSVSTFRRTAFDPLRERCTAYMVRPVSIGSIAQAVARALKP